MALSRNKSDSWTCQFGYDIFGEKFRTLELSDFSDYLQTLSPSFGNNSIIGAFGDSHLRTYFCPEKEVYTTRHITAHIAYVSGASLIGFGRRDSSKGHFNKIKAYCRYIKPRFILLKFGQVDFEQGYYYRKMIKKEDINFTCFVEKLLSSYQEAINQLSNMTNIVVCALNPPTIQDPYEYAQTIKTIILENIKDKDEKIINIYLKHLPKYIDEYSTRLNSILLFNSMLKNIHGISKYIDKNNFFMENGVLRNEFIQKNDVHIKISNEYRINITRSILKDILN